MESFLYAGMRGSTALCSGNLDLFLSCSTDLWTDGSSRMNASFHFSRSSMLDQRRSCHPSHEESFPLLTSEIKFFSTNDGFPLLWKRYQWRIKVQQRPRPSHARSWWEYPWNRMPLSSSLGSFPIFLDYKLLFSCLFRHSICWTEN